MADVVKKDETAGRTDIELILSDGRTVRHTVRPQDTLGALVQVLRRNGHLMGVSDIRVGSSGCLLTGDGWRHKTMKEVGVDRGSTLHISPVCPSSVRVVKLVPESKLSVENRTVSISQAEDVGLDAIGARLRDLPFDPEDPSVVTLQVLSLYLRDGQRRRAVASFDDANVDYIQVDEVDGRDVRGAHKTHLILNFLSKGSGVIAAPTRTPVLQLLVDSEVFNVDEKGLLQLTYKAELLFPSAVLLLRGLRMKDRNGATLAIMIRLCGNEYANIDSGDVFDNPEAAVASMSSVNGTWSFAFILVSSTSLLPQFKIPAKKMISAFTRGGWDVKVAGRRIRGQPTECAEAGSVWMAKWTATQFEFDLTLSMKL